MQTRKFNERRVNMTPSRVKDLTTNEIIELAMSEFQVKHGRRPHMKRVIEYTLELISKKESAHEAV